MNDYSEALVNAQILMKDLHNLLMQSKNAHAFSKCEEIEVEINRLKNWCWKETQDNI